VVGSRTTAIKRVQVSSSTTNIGLLTPINGLPFIVQGRLSFERLS
jgi:hypothetical protein